MRQRCGQLILDNGIECNQDQCNRALVICVCSDGSADETPQAACFTFGKVTRDTNVMFICVVRDMTTTQSIVQPRIFIKDRLVVPSLLVSVFYAKIPTLKAFEQHCCTTLAPLP